MFHVTPEHAASSVLAHGLLTEAPQRTFNCGPVIYLAADEADARRWAGEIARQRGSATRFALLAVATGGLTLVAGSAGATEIGVAQWSCRSDISAERVRLDGVFLAEPVPNLQRGAAGLHACPACGNEYRSAAVLGAHVEQDCEGDLDAA